MIRQFQGEYRWLSNFWITPIKYNGKYFPSVEHAYQASKTLDVTEQEKIRCARTPGQAKRLGRFVTLRSDWDEVKLRLMKKLVVIKFKHPKLRQKLLETGDKMLMEGNHWGDRYWGIDLKTGQGLNHLG